MRASRACAEYALANRLTASLKGGGWQTSSLFLFLSFSLSLSLSLCVCEYVCEDMCVWHYFTCIGSRGRESIALLSRNGTRTYLYCTELAVILVILQYASSMYN